jgi:hypothetical protein
MASHHVIGISWVANASTVPKTSSALISVGLCAAHHGVRPTCALVGVADGAAGGGLVGCVGAGGVGCCG